MFSRFSKSLVAIVVAGLVMAVFALPDSVKSRWPDNAFFRFIKKPKVTLGLDLQGGTQLDYRIDLRNAQAKNEDDDPDNNVRINDITEGVRATIERRVNGLGVSEPQIYLSDVGGEKHIVVELAGIKDVEEAKAVVGKTIQLEFKEQKTEVDPDERQKIEKQANDTLKQTLAPQADFAAIGNNVKTSDQKIDFRSQTKFEDELPEHYKSLLPKFKAGKVHPSVIEGSDGYVITAGGQLSEKKGLYIVQLESTEVKSRTQTLFATLSEVAAEFGKKTESMNSRPSGDFNDTERPAVLALKEGKYTGILTVGDEMRVYKMVRKNGGDSEVKANHILIAYKGAERAGENVTRTKLAAKKEAENIRNQVVADPDKFAELAKQFSDDPGGKTGGDLGFFGKGRMTKAFEEAAFAMDVGDISKVVETEFGYHIIQVTDKRTAPETYDLELLRVPVSDENREKLEGALEKTSGYEVTKDEPSYVYNEIFFDLTPDPWKSTGLDGSHFKFATVSNNQLTGAPEVVIRFDSEGADMFEEITGRLVGKPLAIFVGGQLISSPKVNQKISGGNAIITGNYSLPEAYKLANDLNTGAIDAPIILSGQHTISATLGDDALRTSLVAGLVGLVILALFMILYYRLMGLVAIVALALYSVIILFIIKATGIVMTLAGIAGIILSIGMAVDANILIFERSKEELNEGKNFSASMTAGFDRAWSSIRDSNVSSLITCAILWFFGNSIIRGFALMLAIGILVSMFTAITVTRQFLMTLVGTRLSKNRFLLGVENIETINR